MEEILKNNRLRREATRMSHELFFVVYFSRYCEYEFAKMHQEIFELTHDDNVRLLCITAFRGSAKSTLITMSYALWCILGTQNKKFVTLFSQNRLQAKLLMTGIKRELENNPLLRRDLGPFQEESDEWGVNSLVLSRHGARISIGSVDQSVRGMKHDGHRPDVIICDDIEDLNSVKTLESRNKTYDWFTGEVITLGHKRTRIIVIGNLLHNDGLLARLQEEILNGRRTGVYRSYPLLKEDGSSNWPSMYPDQSAIDELKKKIGDDVAWEREYMLNITSDYRQVVDPSWIVYDNHMPPFSWKENNYFGTFYGVDLALSDKMSADYTAIVAGHVFGNGDKMKIYISDIYCKRIGFPETMETLRSIYLGKQNGQNITFIIEDVAYQRAAVQQAESMRLPVEGFRPVGDKRSRLAIVSRLIKNGSVVFNKETTKALVDNIIGFGKEKHDDLVDAFCMVVLRASEEYGQERNWDIIRII
jgi:predicted phage terminase large subunit-like protein